MSMKKPMPKDEAGWKERLTPSQYEVLRQKRTETPFSGRYVHEKAEGTYSCAACGNPLFASTAKFDSGTGWPSFDEAISGSVEYRPDTVGGINRTEIVCSRCRSHLGHVFDDLPAAPRSAGGPTATRKRYCINSVCLDLEKEKRNS